MMKAERATDEVILMRRQIDEKEDRIKLLGESLQKA